MARLERAPLNLPTLVWLLSTAMGLVYLASLEMLMRRLARVAPTKFAELAHLRSCRGGLNRSTLTRTTG